MVDFGVDRLCKSMLCVVMLVFEGGRLTCLFELLAA